jgi:hypothetical protein
MIVSHTFDLVTDWHFEAPLERVWALVQHVEAWPDWWPAVTSALLLKPGDAQGLGAIHHLMWKTALPYAIAFDVEVVRIEPMQLIEGRARGQLEGRGLWTFEGDAERTHVRYDWQVALAERWMRATVPLLRGIFAWNHGKVMAGGESGARARLTP